MKTLKLGPFLGVNNRLPDDKLQKEQGAFVRAADNVFLTNAGTVKVREADDLIQSMTNPHSWRADSATTGYLVRNGVMYRVTGIDPYGETLFMILSNDNPVCWCAVDGDLYWSNGTDIGRISNGINHPIALPTPSAPAVGLISGTLYVGKYRVGVSYQNQTTGEEGSVSVLTTATLTTEGGIRVTLPAATPGATHVCVYVTGTNGSVPMMHAMVATGTATVDITAAAIDGREAGARFESALPAGRQLAVHNGRLISVSNGVAYYSQPYRYGYVLTRDNYVTVPGGVTMVIPAQGGVYVVGGEKTYWFPGDIAAPQEMIRDVLPYGGVPGTTFESPDGAVVGWFGVNGFVIGDTAGQVSAPMSEVIDQTPPASGCAAVLISHGTRRVVSCGWCMGLENKAITAFSGFDYTAMHGGIGTKATGIYKLESGTSSVTWSIDLGRKNFDSEEEKRLPACYVGAASSAPVSLAVSVPSGDSYSYEARSCSDGLDIHRIDPGRGLKANWFGLSLFGEGAAEISSFSIAPTISQRRI